MRLQGQPKRRQLRSYLPTSRRTFGFSSTCYPETVFRIYIINCPSAFLLVSNGARLLRPRHPRRPARLPRGPRRAAAHHPGAQPLPHRSLSGGAKQPVSAPSTNTLTPTPTLTLTLTLTK